MYKILDGVNSPQDIKNMSIPELKELSKDIRKFLIKKVSITGGHLASNLGVVELTLALHKVFDSPEDKLIWDVGHQSYVHKIITGRKDRFDTLRQYNGLSGFPKEKESIHDAFDTGHSSTSISAGLGIACARDIKKEKFEVVSIIGDGAITGGMAIEALNNLGFLKKNMIVVFNDNEMSIDKNTGAFASYMSKIMRNSDTLLLKENIDKLMNMTLMGERLSRTATKFTESLLAGISPEECGFMEALGIKYFGPIDGHDLEELIDIFRYAKLVEGPKFIHVKTVKGKGYRYAENSPENYHGVGTFDYREGVKKSGKRSISSIVGSTLSDMADKNSNIVAVTAAMPSGTGLNIYGENHPDRYFDVGISEQHAVTFCAGLTNQGLKPYFAVYSTFLQRGYDQLIHDVCINSKPVTFLIDRAGLVGNDGETHHGQFDISYLNPIPNMIIMAPKDTSEMVDMIKLSEKIDSPVAIRYPRGNEYYFRKDDYISFAGYEYEEKKIEIDTLGEPEILYNGFKENTDKIVIFALGNMTIPVSQAVDEISTENLCPEKSFEIVNPRYVKPLSENEFIKIIKEASVVITVEDNAVTGGFGGNIEDIMVRNGLKARLCRWGIPDRFITHGNTSDLMEDTGLSKERLKERITKL